MEDLPHWEQGNTGKTFIALLDRVCGFVENILDVLRMIHISYMQDRRADLPTE